MKPDKIRAVLVDDEAGSIESLETIIKESCPNVIICGTANSVKEAIKSIDLLEPNLVFLDIAMTDGDGFEVISGTSFKDYNVVFTTAYDQYAIKAIEFSALYYIMKPIDEKDVIEAIRRHQSKSISEAYKKQIEVLSKYMDNNFENIVLPQKEDSILVNLSEIVYCEADGSYTNFHLIDKRRIVISKPLKTYDELLGQFQFCRIHASIVVNLNQVNRYIKGRGGQVEMKNKITLPVSTRRKQEFLDKLKYMSL